MLGGEQGLKRVVDAAK
jgi:hypothetical protein